MLDQSGRRTTTSGKDYICRDGLVNMRSWPKEMTWLDGLGGCCRHEHYTEPHDSIERQFLLCWATTRIWFAVERCLASAMALALCQVGGHAVCVNTVGPTGLAMNMIDRDRHAAMQGMDGQGGCGLSA